MMLKSTNDDTGRVGRVKDWLSTVDPDTFVADLLDLQKKTAGPTLDDFIDHLTTLTRLN